MSQPPDANAADVVRAPRARNDRLAKALVDAALSYPQVAGKLSVSPKTVERWVVDGRRPYRRSRDLLARLVNVPVDDLWPEPQQAEEQSVVVVDAPRMPASQRLVVVRNRPLYEALIAANLTYEQVAERLDVDPSTPERWVTEGRVPYPRHRTALAQLLGEHEARLWPSAFARTFVWAPSPGTALDDSGTSADISSQVDSVDEVDRRGLLAALGGGFAGVVVNQPAFNVFAAPHEVPPELPVYFAGQLASHVAIDTRVGAQPLLSAVATQYRSIRQAADAARGETSSDLLGVGVAYAGFVGWLYQDAGDLNSAWRWCSETLELAHRTGDPDMVAYALASLAYVRFDAGDGPGAVDLANAALATPGLRQHTRLYALRHAVYAHTLTGQRDTVDRILDERGVLLADHSEDSAYRWGQPWWAAITAQDAQQATCYGQLGYSADAATLWEQVLDRQPGNGRRDRGVYQARYATALLSVEGADAAAGPASQAVDAWRCTGSARMRRELTQLRDQIEYHDAASRNLADILHDVA